MTETHKVNVEVAKPACPSCGSSARVIRMANSLTPFERPFMQTDLGGHWFCQACAHDFEPEPEEAE
jgi:hypothetical protein